MNVHCIGFGIDEGRLRPLLDLSTKTQAFSTLIPGKAETYRFRTSEAEYYDEYAKSYYAFTWKKCGWDCLRHYEILAAGALPYFSDLLECPAEVCAHYPKELVLEAMRLPGVSAEGTIDFSVFPKDSYDRLRHRMREHTLQHLTTRAVASSFLRTLGSPKTVLYLTAEKKPDYQRCLLLIGLKQVLGGPNVLDCIKVDHIYSSFGLNTLKLYGRGYSYTKTLKEDPDLDRSRSGVAKAILSHRYDIVVYGSMHRKLPYFNLVRRSYKAEEIVFVCGEDEHQCFVAADHCPQFVRERHCLPSAP